MRLLLAQGHSGERHTKRATVVQRHFYRVANLQRRSQIPFDNTFTRTYFLIIWRAATMSEVRRSQRVSAGPSASASSSSAAESPQEQTEHEHQDGSEDQEDENADSGADSLLGDVYAALFEDKIFTDGQPLSSTSTLLCVY